MRLRLPIALCVLAGAGSIAQAQVENIARPAIQRVMVNGANAAREPAVNFIGGGLTIADNPGAGRIDLTLGATANSFRLSAGAPGGLANGDVWYDTNANSFFFRQNGSSLDLGLAVAKLPLAGGTMVGNILATDNSFTLGDITHRWFQVYAANYLAGGLQMAFTTTIGDGASPSYVFNSNAFNGNAAVKFCDATNGTNCYLKFTPSTGSSQTSIEFDNPSGGALIGSLLADNAASELRLVTFGAIAPNSAGGASIGTSSRAFSTGYLATVLQPANATMTFSDSISDGAGAIGFTFNTSNAIVTAGSKIVSFKSNSTEALSLGTNGAQSIAYLRGPGSADGFSVGGGEVDTVIGSTSIFYATSSVFGPLLDNNAKTLGDSTHRWATVYGTGFHSGASQMALTSGLANGATPAFAFNTTNAFSSGPAYDFRSGGNSLMQIYPNYSSTDTGLIFNNAAGALTGALVPNSTTALRIYNFASFAPFGDKSAALGTSGLRWKREYVTGTASIAGDYGTPSAGWGATASVGAITGDDVDGQFIMTSAGAGQAVNATEVYTFHDGTWVNAPTCAVRNNGTSNAADANFQYTVTTNATTMTITNPNLPVAARTYTIAWHCFGK